MIKVIRRILTLANTFKSKIIKAMLCGFLGGIFKNMTIFSILFILVKITNKTLTINAVIVSGGLILVGIVGQFVFKYLVYILQSATGYEIFERERIKIGDRFKRYPMGYFSEGNMGNISAVITSDLTFIEMVAMDTIDKVVNGYVSIMIGCIFLLLLDYRLALITVVVTLLPYMY